MTIPASHDVSWRRDDDGIVTLLLGSGRRRNALGRLDWARLAEVVEMVAEDERARVLVLRGTGATFCSGSDLGEWQGASEEEVTATFEVMERALKAIEQSPVPAVAQIDGVAAGAGCQLALACDLRIMSSTARIGMPIARLSILPSYAFAGRLVLAVGSAAAAELLYTGRLIDASQAEALGLVNEVVPATDLPAVVAGTAGEIAMQPPAAVRAAKRALQGARGTTTPGWPGRAVEYGGFQQAVAKYGPAERVIHPDTIRGSPTGLSTAAAR